MTHQKRTPGGNRGFRQTKGRGLHRNSSTARAASLAMLIELVLEPALQSRACEVRWAAHEAQLAARKIRRLLAGGGR